jgi:hypothetical protein
VAKSGNFLYHIDRTDRRIISDLFLPLDIIYASFPRVLYTKTNAATTSVSTLGNLISGNPTAPFQFTDPVETYNVKGGSSAYVNIKNLLTYSSIKELINTDDPQVKYYEVTDIGKISTTNFKLKCIEPDQIIKSGVLAYVNDTDVPIEYIGANLIGYDIVNTNQTEVIFRHRGSYEPKAVDVLSFWVREDEEFSKHFEKDFLLYNTHFNIKSNSSGLIRNRGVNKVADAEILKIKSGSAYKSVYPLVGEVPVDNKDIFILNSTWDKNYYRKYYDLTNWNDLNGINDMQEFKSLFGSKVMNVPTTQLLETFNSNEVLYVVSDPTFVVGVPLLKFVGEFADPQGYLNNVSATTKPTLTIDLDIRTRLLRKLYEDMAIPGNFDEFNWLKTLGITDFEDSNFSSSDVERLKREYLEKNILQLYTISEIKLYALSKEGLLVFDSSIDDDAKTLAGYRVDKDCQVTNLDEFIVRITKPLDTKKPFGYSVTAVIKRI